MQPPPPQPQMAVPPVHYQVNQYPGQQATVGIQQPQPQIIYAAPPQQSSRRDKYPEQWGVWLGALLTAGGALCIILNSVGMAISAAISFASHGIWVGVLFVISGGLTIGAGRSRNAGLIIGSMVMSIIASVCSVVVISSAAIGAAIEGYYYGYYADDRHARVAVNITLAVCGAVCGLLCIAISILGCVGLCGGTEAQNGRIVSTQPQQGAQMIVISTSTQPNAVNPAMAYPGQSQPQMAPSNPPAYAPNSDSQYVQIQDSQQYEQLKAPQKY